MQTRSQAEQDRTDAMWDKTKTPYRLKQQATMVVLHPSPRCTMWLKPERVPTIEKQLSLIAKGKVVAGNVPRKGKCARRYPSWNADMSTLAYVQSYWAYNFHASPEELKAFFIPLSDEPAPYYHEQEVTIEPNEDYVGDLV